MLGYHLLASGGIVHGNDEITALHEKALEEAGDIQPCRARAQSFLAENVAVIQVRDVEVSDERAAEAVADSAQGDPEDQRLAVYTLSWTHALRGQPVDDLVEAFEGFSTKRGYLARYPQRVAGQRHVWRGEIARPARCSRPSWPGPRSGASRRRTPSRGCTCARWSCASATGTPCSG